MGIRFDVRAASCAKWAVWDDAVAKDKIIIQVPLNSFFSPAELAFAFVFVSLRKFHNSFEALVVYFFLPAISYFHPSTS